MTVDTNDLIVLFLVAQTVLIPILGGLYLGIRGERIRQSRLLVIATTRVRFGARGGFGK